MNLICLALFLFALPLFAQNQCNYKLYVDSLHGFSMRIPPNQNIEKDKLTVYGYDIRETNKFKYRFFLEPKSEFLSTLRDNEKLDSADTLLSMAENKCYFSLKSRGDRAEGYGRIDSLIQWINDYNIRIIEIHRTQVFKVFSGSFEYEKVGPLYLIKLVTAKGEFYLRFDLYDYYNYASIKKIISSIKVI